MVLPRPRRFFRFSPNPSEEMSACQFSFRPPIPKPIKLAPPPSSPRGGSSCPPSWMIARLGGTRLALSFNVFLRFDIFLRRSVLDLDPDLDTACLRIRAAGSPYDPYPCVNSPLSPCEIRSLSFCSLLELQVKRPSQSFFLLVGPRAGKR